MLQERFYFTYLSPLGKKPRKQYHRWFYMQGLKLCYRCSFRGERERACVFKPSDDGSKNAGSITQQDSSGNGESKPGPWTLDPSHEVCTRTRSLFQADSAVDSSAERSDPCEGERSALQAAKSVGEAGPVTPQYQPKLRESVLQNETHLHSSMCTLGEPGVDPIWAWQRAISQRPKFNYDKTLSCKVPMQKPSCL